MCRENGSIAGRALVLTRLLERLQAGGMHGVTTEQHLGADPGREHVLLTNWAVTLETLLDTGMIRLERFGITSITPRTVKECIAASHSTYPAILAVERFLG